MNKDKTTGRSSELLCSHCGSKIEMCDNPESVFAVQIPFTVYTLEIWNWHKQIPVCLSCRYEKERRYEGKIFDVGAEKGYEQGYEAGLKERY